MATLGCPKNDADSRWLMRQLLAAGVVLVDDPRDSTHILLNTCGFIKDAKEESIGVILETCSLHPERAVLVMGCLVERYRSELEKGIPEVDGWFGLPGPDVATRLLELLRGGPSSHEERFLQACPAPASFAYVKVSDGCDEPCTFCAIPGIKGPYRALSLEEIRREAEACLAEGAHELVLVGQDTSRWGGDGLGLEDLIDGLAADPRVRRIRLMYLQPDGVTERLLRYMASQPRLCRYLDVPFQHSHPDILRPMARTGDASSYLALIERARRLMPDVSIRSTFIVGFPGETASHFEHLLDFVRRAGFDYAGGFVYSPEEGTKAAGLRPRVGRARALERLDRLNAALCASTEERNRELIGSQVEVMIDTIQAEEDEEGQVAIGRTEGQAPEVDGVTYIEGRIPEGSVPGDIVSARVDAAVGYDLIVRYEAP